MTVNHQDAMDDSGAPGVSTPEHWSDVGPLSSRIGLVEQQVQSVQVPGMDWLDGFRVYLIHQEFLIMYHRDVVFLFVDDREGADEFGRGTCVCLGWECRVLIYLQNARFISAA